MSHFGNRCCTEQVLQYLLKEKIISPENPCGLFIDKNVLEENIKELNDLLDTYIPAFKPRFVINDGKYELVETN